MGSLAFSVLLYTFLYIKDEEAEWDLNGSECITSSGNTAAAASVLLIAGQQDQEQEKSNLDMWLLNGQYTLLYRESCARRGGYDTQKGLSFDMYV